MYSNRKQEIVEETPTLRSIKIGSLSAPPPLSRSFASPLKFQQQQEPAFKANVNASDAEACSWSVDEQLPSLEADYVLERTNVYVSNTTAQDVADRISNSLKVNSIAAKVSEDNKNSLHAETSQGLKFAVSLFADDASLVVEVQRRQGCSVEFRQASKAVCKSAKGLAAGPPMRKFTIPSSIPRDSAEEQAKRYRAGLETSFNLIGSDRLDSQLMGFESIEKLSTKPQFASEILEGERLEIIIATIGKTSESIYHQEQHASLMRRKALTILANCVSAYEVIPDEVTQEHFVRELLDCLRNSSDQPHEAYQAARLLQALSSSNTAMQALLNDLNAISVIPSVECNHMALAQESSKLRQVLSL